MQTHLNIEAYSIKFSTSFDNNGNLWVSNSFVNEPTCLALFRYIFSKYLKKYLFTILFKKFEMSSHQNKAINSLKYLYREVYLLI